MKRLLLLLLFISSFAFSQTLCEQCVEQNGFYCGDDPANWTQYSPDGCVPNGLNDLFYLNDGWEDCVDASDEQDSVPTTLGDCESYVEPCDTVYVDIPVIEYDTIVEIEYVVDTIYIDIINWFPEYVDCETMLPCGSSLGEILNKSIEDGLMYNLNGQVIMRPKDIYIKNGLIKYLVR